ncbi:MAG: UvrD-helicase domain-containing protein [Campylobacterota bacterium]|nr:UvrD-helicase domain-containing protein [Campylobacterota bacterium]
MRAITKQISIKYSEKDALDESNKNISLNISKYENNITLLQTDISNIFTNINAQNDKIKNLSINFKVNIFEKFIELISFGIVNYKQKHLKNLDSIKSQIQKLQNSITPKEQYVSNEKTEIVNLQLKQSNINQQIEQIQSEIIELESKFNKKLELFKNKLLDFQTNIISLSKDRYINDYTRIELKNELNTMVYNQEEFITHKNIKQLINDVIIFYNNDKSWIENRNKLFVKNEKNNEKLFFDTIESNPLTQKQQEAVLINENNNLILAGAGSGKTSVIVAKVCYLINKEILHPNEILILAFNKNAQEELKERFEHQNIHVQIKTFHSFGLSIISQTILQKMDLCPMTESQNNMTKFIKDTIYKLMSSMGVFLKDFIEFIAYFSIPYKNESEFENLGEYYDYQKNYDMKTFKHKVIEKGKNQGKGLTTLKEETVKSHQELVICNFLTLNGIRYLYEEPYEIKTWTMEKRQYKPDYYLPDYGIYIEHFGIDRNNKTAPFVNNKEYLEGIEWKRNLHQENETILVETFSSEFTENNLLKRLKEKLLKYNVEFRELSQAEIAELLKEPIENNKFTKLFTTFLNHFKSNRFTIEDVKEKSQEIERTSLFIKLFEFIFKEYQDFQKRNNCIDFDDMIIEALNNVNKGKYNHGFKHIFIDEFQDISTTRALLIKELLPLNNTSITAVGDDWQSINRFAGSNIKIIQDFEETFGVSKTVALDYTFRFDNIVSDIASDFIQKNPNQLKKEIKTIKNQELNKFSICLYWTTGNIKSDLEAILDLIVKKEKDNKKSVMILARYNFLFKEIRSDNYKKLEISPYLKNKYLTLQMSLASVHGSKGNEADYVIILNIDNGKFGFPSKIEDDPILSVVVPEGDDFEDAEERRLFYVALTRTKGTLFLLGNMYEKSIFMDEVIENYKDEIYFLNDPKIKLLNCPECKTGLLKKRTSSNDKSKHFYGCSNFPRCKFTENVHYCPQCDNETIKDYDKKVAKCTGDSCDFESTLCIKCHGYMIKRKGKYGDFLGCSNYPKCSHSTKIEEETIISSDNPF